MLGKRVETKSRCLQVAVVVPIWTKHLPIFVIDPKAFEREFATLLVGIPASWADWLLILKHSHDRPIQGSESVDTRVQQVAGAKGRRNPAEPSTGSDQTGEKRFPRGEERWVIGTSHRHSDIYPLDVNRFG